MKNILIGVFLTLLVLSVGAVAFYFGKNSLQKTNTSQTTPSSQNSLNATPMLTPTPTQTQTKTYQAGGILVFKAYTLSAPLDWTVTTEKNSYMDNLILTKGGYKITISQAAGGGGGCLYPGDAPKEMAQNFTSFTEIQNPNGFVFRRGESGASPQSYTVCQKNTTDGSFGFPTIFGNITIASPTEKNDLVLTEIDSILASINKK